MLRRTSLLLGVILLLASRDAFAVMKVLEGIREWLVVAVPDTGTANVDGVKTDWIEKLTGGKLKETTVSTVANGPKPGDKLGVPAAFELRELKATSDVIDLDAVFEPARDNNNITAYMLTYITAASAKKLDLFVGSDDCIVVWINGREIHRNPALRGAGRDQDKIAGVDLSAGKNVLMLKIVEQGGGWGSFARFSDYTGLQFSSNPAVSGSTPGAAEYLDTFIGVMVPNHKPSAAQEATGIDLLDLHTKGVWTELKIASNGVKRGAKVGDFVWTEGALPSLGGNNLQEWGEKVLKKSGDINDTTWYGYTAVISPNDRNTEIWVGSDDGIVVWVNGVEVHRNPALRGLGLDADKKPVALKRGSNHLLVKVIEQGGGFAVSVRFKDMDGLVVDSTATAVNPAGKLVTAWGAVKNAH